MSPALSADLWNALPVASLIVDAEGRIVDVNASAESYLNVSAKRLLNTSPWDKLAFNVNVETAIERVHELGSPLTIHDVEVMLSTREKRSCDIEIVPMERGSRQLLLIFMPRIGAENGNRVSSAQSVIGLAEMLAHEIKNPLAGISGAAQLLSMGLKGDDLALTELIVDETRRVVKLLEQVEQFGNTRPPDCQVVNIHDVLDQARKSAALGDASHINFVEDYDPSLPATFADPDQLVQVFLNLFKNAAQVGKPGGTITLRSFYRASLMRKRKDGSRAKLPLQVEVIDDGPGIPPEMVETIFDPFVSGRENGTGLGLALVWKILSDHGAWIMVESEPGRTVFRMSLALAPDEGPETNLEEM